MRAAEIDAEIMLKSTRVEGVYNKDPETDKDAEIYENLSYSDVINKKLAIMDLTAITLCEEKSMPVRVFNGTVKGNITKAITGQSIGTYIGDK